MAQGEVNPRAAVFALSGRPRRSKRVRFAVAHAYCGAFLGYNLRSLSRPRRAWLWLGLGPHRGVVMGNQPAAAFVLIDVGVAGRRGFLPLFAVGERVEPRVKGDVAADADVVRPVDRTAWFLLEEIYEVAPDLGLV